LQGVVNTVITEIVSIHTISVHKVNNIYVHCRHI
jgi:hypothetical protein